jgi:ABC-type multidrug transport system permease subunit
MWRRILAILVARNREFYRDKAGLGWNILMPILMVMGFAFIFAGPPEDLFKVGVIRGPDGSPASPFLATRHVTFVPVADRAAGVLKVERHQLDLLLDLSAAPAYWVNLNSARGYLAERLLLGAGAAAPGDGGAPPAPTAERRTVTGEALSYADWVLPGVLAMNVMFSSLWGVGWVVVRYRKNAVLRRLKATPLTPFEFLAAQVLSRLLVVLGASLIVYLGTALFLDFPMRGSYAALALIFASGALCLISLGLIVSARLRTEELADGILNLISWPMLLLSGVWFSLEGTSPAAQALSGVFPLSHMVAAARRVMIDGAGVLEILPEVSLLSALALVLLAVAARLFRWE